MFGLLCQRFGVRNRLLSSLCHQRWRVSPSTIDWAVKHASESHSVHPTVQKLIVPIKENLISFCELYCHSKQELDEADQELDPVLDFQYLNEIKKNNEKEVDDLYARFDVDYLLLSLYDPQESHTEVLIEFRPGVGGNEACLFTRDLVNMYQKFSGNMGWDFTPLEDDETTLGGAKFFLAEIKGDNVWSIMQHEGGVVRVQRIPVTDSKGKMQTSSASITVLPKLKKVDFVLNPSDLKFEFKRSPGPGGQSVNTSNSACRITHIPSKISVNASAHNNLADNKELAMHLLQSRLADIAAAEHEQLISDKKKAQVTSRNRSDKCRTFNFMENRVVDHRTGASGDAWAMIENAEGLYEMAEELRRLRWEVKIKSVEEALEKAKKEVEIQTQ